MRDQPAFNLVAREGGDPTVMPLASPGDYPLLAARNEALRLAVLPSSLFAVRASYE